MKTPFINREELEAIVAEFPTPFHLYDEKGIREKARAEPSTKLFRGTRALRNILQLRLLQLQLF